MPLMIDRQTGQVYDVPEQMGAYQPWSGAYQPWSGGPLDRFRERMAERKQGRQEDKIERLLPPGMGVYSEAQIDQMLRELESYKQAGKSLPPSLQTMPASPSPVLQGAQQAAVGGGLGLTIGAATAFAGDAASTNVDSAVAVYPFWARRLRLYVTGAAGFGVRITAIQIATTQPLIGFGISCGPNQNGFPYDFAAPVYVPQGVAIVVTRQGSTGINAATGNYTLVLEP